MRSLNCSWAYIIYPRRQLSAVMWTGWQSVSSSSRLESVSLVCQATLGFTGRNEPYSAGALGRDVAGHRVNLILIAVTTSQAGQMSAVCSSPPRDQFPTQRRRTGLGGSVVTTPLDTSALRMNGGRKTVHIAAAADVT